MPSETSLRFRKSQCTNEFVLHTGDLCKIDADGYIYFIERMDQLIKHHGIRMSATEVEEVACGLNDLLEAALIKLDDDDTLHLLVTTQSHLPVEEIFAFLNEELPLHKVPNFIHILSELPKTQNGKLDRKKLKASTNISSAND